MIKKYQTQWLQYLNNKKQQQGFTLIELLIVIVILGILSAIMLPNFINQSAKAKQSEAKQYIGDVNRSQTIYRTENNRYANSFDELNMANLQGGTNELTNNYSYILTAATDTATIVATSRDTSAKGYSGGNYRYVNSTFESGQDSALCESRTPGTTTAMAPTPSGTALVCPNNYNTIK